MKLRLVLLLPAGLMLFGCGGKKEPQQKPDQPRVAATPDPNDKLTVKDTVVGQDSRVAEAGDMLWVLYKGYLKSGTVFDTNEGKDDVVYAFELGSGGVIKGWDQGLIGMHPGSTRHLHIPPSLGYGKNAMDSIPANSDLEFDIQLVGLSKAGEDNVIDTSDDPVSNSLHILSPIKVGAGPAVKSGDTVTIQYTGTLLNGKVFDDSHKSGGYTFTVGEGKTLPCIDTGVVGMKQGGVREIIAPPAVAYVGRPGTVPPNSEVKFRIEMVSVKPGKPM